MSSIDNRIVNMEFNNSKFLSGVKDSVGALDKLKKGLDVKGAAKNLTDLDAAAKNVSFQTIADGVQNISSKFTAMGAVAFSVLNNMTSRAIDAGMNIARSLTVEPILDGYREYETQLNSVQTILANTESKGSNIDDVNKALGTLNTYADKTIYNFSEMTRNIGTFTAAGVGLEDSTMAIQGIANLAAVSGSNSQQASTAMYQLSQAMAAGTLKLQDWNSVVNAGMGGQVFQDALKDTAKHYGTNVDALIEKNGSFRESLQEGWITTDILTETLAKLTYATDGATKKEIQANREQLKKLGYNDEEIKQIEKKANTANNAATKVKSLTQLMDTLQEAVGSGWAQTWQMVFGDFEEAKKLFTGVSDTLGALIQESADSRNKIIKDWKKLGGRKALIEGLGSAFKAVMGVIKPFKNAFRDIFPPVTGKQLATFTKQFAAFMKQLIPSKEVAKDIRRTFRGVFAVLDIGWMVVKALAGVFKDLFSAIFDGSGSFLNFTGDIGDFLVALRDAIKNGTVLTSFFSGLSKVLVGVVGFFKMVGRTIASMFDGVKGVDTSGFESIIDIFREIGQRALAPFQAFGRAIVVVWNAVTKATLSVYRALQPVFDALGKIFKDVGERFKDFFSNLDMGDAGSLLAGGGVAALAAYLYENVGKILKFFKKGSKDLKGLGGEFKDAIMDIFGGVTDTFTAMQQNLKAGTLMKIAAAVGILTLSVIALSMIDPGKLAAALGAITVMFAQLGATLYVFQTVLSKGGLTQLPLVAAALILLGVAIGILTISVTALSKLDLVGLAKGLGGVMVMLGAFAGTAKLMRGSAKGLLSTGLAMIPLATGVLILSKAVEKFSQFSWADLAKGAAAVGGALTVLAGYSQIAKTAKGSIRSAVSIVILAGALSLLADVVSKFIQFSWGELAKGGAAVAGALVAIGLGMQLMPKNMLFTAAALVVVSSALLIMGDAFAKMAELSWGDFGKVMATLGGALLILAVGLTAMSGSLSGSASLLIAAAALSILAPILLSMQEISWDGFGKAMALLGGSLLILAIGLTAMSGAIPGAIALTVASAALAILTPILKTLGAMSWSEIGTGLVALAAALAVLAVGGLALIPALPGLLGLGGAVALMGVGLLAAGVGMTALAAGITALAAAGAVGLLAFKEALVILIGLIPSVFEAIGLGLVSLITTIASMADQIMQAFVTIFSSILEALATLIPQIVQLLIDLITMLLTALAEALPQMIQAGMDIIIALLQGVANNIGQVVETAITVIVNFLNGIANQLGSIIQAGVNIIVNFLNGIANAIPQIVDAAVNVMISFINTLSAEAVKLVDAGFDALINFIDGITNSVSANLPRLMQAGKDLAFAIADGLTGGLASKIGDVVAKAKDLAGKALDGAKNFLGINSPSKEFHKIGGWSGEGLANGLDAMGRPVEHSGRRLGEKTLSSVKKAMSGIDSELDRNIDLTPTIAPVLDLTKVKKDANRLGNLMAIKKLNPEDLRRRVDEIKPDKMRNPYQPNVDSSLMPIQKIQPLVFNQTNNSPKALSDIEIYRQTKNLINVVKGG